MGSAGRCRRSSPSPLIFPSTIAGCISGWAPRPRPAWRFAGPTERSKKLIFKRGTPIADLEPHVTQERVLRYMKAHRDCRGVAGADLKVDIVDLAVESKLV